jgi:hypothetical protein
MCIESRNFFEYEIKKKIVKKDVAIMNSVLVRKKYKEIVNIALTI